MIVELGAADAYRWLDLTRNGHIDWEMDIGVHTAQVPWLGGQLELFMFGDTRHDPPRWSYAMNLWVRGHEPGSDSDDRYRIQFVPADDSAREALAELYQFVVEAHHGRNDKPA